MRSGRVLVVIAGFAAGVAGAVQDPAPATRVDVQVARGAADTRVRLGVPLREAGPGRTGVDLVFKLKAGRQAMLPGASTGPDQAIQLELQRPFAGWTGFGHAGWRSGPAPDPFSPRRERWYGEIGASRALARGFELGAQIDVRQSLAGAKPLREATAYAAFGAGPWRWELSLTRGFATTVPDTAIELSLRARF